MRANWMSLILFQMKCLSQICHLALLLVFERNDDTSICNGLKRHCLQISRLSESVIVSWWMWKSSGGRWGEWLLFSASIIVCSHLAWRRGRQGALSLQTDGDSTDGNINFFPPRVNVFHNTFKGLDYISNERLFSSYFKLHLEEFLWQCILEI